MLRTFGALLISAALVLAAAPTIGTISSNGRFRIDGAEIWKQGSLSEGAAVQTQTAASRLLFRNGTDIRLGSAAQGRVYANRLVLESGALEGLLPRTFHVETSTLGLRVQGENSRAHISVNDGTITVASLQGPLRIRGAQGLLLAALEEGNSVQLSPAQGANAGMKLTGVVEHQNKAYFLTDETTGVRVEIRGMDVAKQVGQRVTVTGEVDTAVVPGGKAEYVVRVTRFETPVASSATAGAAGSAPGTAGGTAAGTAAGIGTATKVGIIAGVAVAGAATTGLVIAGGDDPAPTVSPEP